MTSLMQNIFITMFTMSLKEFITITKSRDKQAEEMTNNRIGMTSMRGRIFVHLL